MPDVRATPDPALSAALQPTPAPESAEVIGEDDIRFARGPRHYRVRGLARNLSAQSLKVTLRAYSSDAGPQFQFKPAPDSGACRPGQ